LSSPELQETTLASLLGNASRRTVRVNGSTVTIPAYLRAVARLSNQVADQSEAEFIPGLLDVACTIPPAVVISGYSEYSHQLNTDQQAIITRLAQQIVDSFSGNTPIVAIRVVGHADTALRKPIKERPAFEMKVSVQRAQSAERDLRAEIDRLGKGKNPEPIKNIRFLPPVGMGATKKFVSHPINESQMRLNRRVEIYFSECLVPTEWTWIDAATRGLAILPPGPGAHDRVRCMLKLLLKLKDQADDGYLDYQNWKNLFFPPGFSDEQKKKLMESAVTHLEKQLGVRSVYGPANEVSDKDFNVALESIDEVITRSMRDFKLNAEAGGAGASVLIVRGWNLIQTNRTNPNSIYSCYASYSW